MMRMHVFFVMMITNSTTDKYCSKISENVRLDKCHQDLDYIDKYGKRY